MCKSKELRALIKEEMKPTEEAFNEKFDELSNTLTDIRNFANRSLTILEDRLFARIEELHPST